MSDLYEEDQEDEVSRQIIVKSDFYRFLAIYSIPNKFRFIGKVLKNVMIGEPFS